MELGQGSEGELGQGWLLASLGNYALHPFCKRNDGTLATVGRWGGIPLCVTVLYCILSKQQGQERKQTQGVLHAFLTRNLKKIQI